MLDNTAVHSEACPYKPMVDPGKLISEISIKKIYTEHNRYY